MPTKMVHIAVELTKNYQMEVHKVKLHLAHVMALDLILRVHAAKIMIGLNVLEIHVLTTLVST